MGTLDALLSFAIDSADPAGGWLPDTTHTSTSLGVLSSR